MPQHHTQSAFTLMEMIVAISIAALLMLFINSLFNDTSRAVQLGMATGNAVVTSETINDQLNRDVDHMLGPQGGPNPGGYLIIINRLIGDYNGNRRLDANEGVQIPRGDGTGSLRLNLVRSDQLVFIATSKLGKPFHSMTPRAWHTLGNQIQANRARIWYGHIQRTNHDGTDPLNPELGTGLDALGHTWILGRQSLLIDPNVALITDYKSHSDIHATGIFYNNSILPSGYAPFDNRLWRGLTDVADATYDPSALTFPTGYLATTFAAERLRANPMPESMDFASWRIAQTHPILAQNVSDFVVEFAADVNNDGQIDTDTLDIDINGDGEPDIGDGQPDTDPRPGNIVWYGLDLIPNGTGNPGYTSASFNYTASYSNFNPIVDPAPTPFDTNADLAFIWEYNDDMPTTTPTAANNSAWPHLLRIRYRMHDEMGRMISTDDSRLADNIDNDLDGDFDEDDEGRISGRWFEHIVRVNRPD